MKLFELMAALEADDKVMSVTLIRQIDQWQIFAKHDNMKDVIFNETDKSLFALESKLKEFCDDRWGLSAP